MTTYLAKCMPVPVGTNINMEIKSALSYSFSFFHLLIERFNGLSRKNRKSFTLTR